MEKICNLYINDSHLSITLIEYIKKEISKGIKIIVVSQDDIKQNIKSLSNKFKQSNLDDKIDILKEIEERKIKFMDNTSVIIKGDNDFILKTEESFNELFKTNNINANIISCYNISESNNVYDITTKYSKMLNTSGIVDINNVEQLI